jgi:hypothetical protein
MAIAYAATTMACTFLMDADGVCRRVLMRRERRADTTLGGRTRSQAAKRCIGAQYVAAIDVQVEGGLVPMPRVGSPMLFAYTGEDGRLAVVRTGPLVKFETVAPSSSSTSEIPVDWEEPDEPDDQTNTIPLAQSGERRTPTRFLDDTDPWTPPPPSPSWASLPPMRNVRLQKVNVAPPSESAPTLRMLAPTGRGLLPKKAGRR